MKINNEGRSLIKFYESLKLKAYLCPSRIPTIGWGTTVYPNGKPVKMGDSCTPEQAEIYFEYDIKRFETDVLKLVKKPLTANQFSALVSFAYNLGLGNLGISTLLKKINVNPNDPTIRTELQKWVYGTEYVKDEATKKMVPVKVKLNGLINRRGKEADLYFKK